MKLLYVIPRYANSEVNYEFPLGLASVASYMKHKGFDVFCLNTCHHSGTVAEQISEWIHDKQIDMVCTGGISLHFDVIAEVFQAAKEVKKDILTVAGGPIISCDPQLALENMPIDFGILGEGEETMAELTASLSGETDVRDVRGLSFLDEQRNLVTTGPRDSITDLDRLPMPEYEAFDYNLFVSRAQANTFYHYYTVFDDIGEVRVASIISSRGCPFNCTFCYHPLGNGYRQRSLDSVFEEIDYLKKTYNINLLFLLDELFSVDKRRMYDFAKRIKNYDIKWIPQLRVNDVDEEVLNILKESGVIAIGYGVESISNKILKSMNKQITKASIEKALRLTRQAQIATAGNILFGDPAETEETLDETMTWWMNHLEYGLSLKMIMPIPDSLIYRQAVAKGLIEDKMQHVRDGFPPVNMTELSDSRFREIREFVLNYLNDEKCIVMGKVIRSRKEYTNREGRDVFSVVVECPECHAECEYNGLARQVMKNLLFLCKNCLMTFYVEAARAFSGKHAFYDLISYIRSKIHGITT